MKEQLLEGTPASPGAAVGGAWHLRAEVDQTGAVPSDQREQERETALVALAATADSLMALAAGLPTEEAQIVETGALIAQDPALIDAVERAVLDQGLTAAAAIARVSGEHADQIAAIDDETLAARADDVRSLGRRAAALAGGRDLAASPPASELILIAHDVGPADVAELAPALAGIALAGGGATAHAAIVARSLGVPMVTGLSEQVLEIDAGAPLLIDGMHGTVVLAPGEERARAAKAEMRARSAAARRAYELRDRPAVTVDGTQLAVLANVASAEELERGVRAGAEGIGLLRTELAFLDARAWPTEQQHTDALKPILAGLAGRPAIVRVLDFGADKSPPFLRDIALRGLELLLQHPDAFIRQLRAIVLAARRDDVRILLPMVDTPEQVTQSRALIERVVSQLGVESIPQLGSMIETPLAVRNAIAIAERSDFLSIGTNDLTAATLGADRFTANTAHAHHPLVLRSIASSVAAAHQAGIRIEVCGEAASDPITLPLLVGLEIDEVSVGAARVEVVRDWVRQLNFKQAAALARSALTMDTAGEVEWALGPLTTEHALVR